MNEGCNQQSSARIANIFLVWMVLCWPFSVTAQAMSSTNYKVQSDALGDGAVGSSSTSYNAISTLGDLASGEDSTSTNYSVCSGFECVSNPNYVSFSVTEGTSLPGTVGAGVALGTITPSAVIGSNHSSINSVFLSVSSGSSRGMSVVVISAHAGLKRTSTTDTIASATTTLVAGTAGYGVCVASVASGSDSPTVLTAQSLYSGACDTGTGHGVGVVDTSAHSIVSATGVIKSGSSEILVKAAASTSTVNGDDYTDALNFVLVPTY